MWNSRSERNAAPRWATLLALGWLAVAALSTGCATDDAPVLGSNPDTTDTDVTEADVEVDTGADQGGLAPDSGEIPDGCEVGACGPDGQCVQGVDGTQCVCDTDAVLVDGECHAGCPEHPDCRYWTLDGGWTSQRIDGLPADIVAAFDIEETDVAYVLSESELFRLNLVTRELENVGDLTPVVVGLEFDSILSAFSIPAAHVGRPDGEDVFQIVGLVDGVPNFSSGNYAAGTFTIEVQEDFDIPDFDEASLRAQWLDINNTQGWAPTSAQCPDQDRPVSFLVTESRIYYSEASGGDCSGISGSDTLESSQMFGLDVVPPTDKIRAAFYHDGKLSVFTAP